jgi:hypothetical protein
LRRECSRTANELHVLLRHRLLPQPGGFEGFLGGWVSHHRDDYSFADREDASVAERKFANRASFRSEPVVDDHHDPIAALEEVQRLRDPGLKACSQLVNNPLQDFASPVCPGSRSFHERELEVWVGIERRRLAYALLDANVPDARIRDQLEISQKTLARRRRELADIPKCPRKPALQSGAKRTKTPGRYYGACGPILHADASTGNGDFGAIRRLLGASA